MSGPRIVSPHTDALDRAVRRIRLSPMHAALDVLGDVSSLHIIRQAATGRHRFEDFIEALGLPRATLSARLKLLAKEDVLDSSYALTALGADALGAVLLLDGWNAEHGVGPRRGSVPLHSCGRRLEVRVQCAHCQGEAGWKTVRVLDFPGSSSGRPWPALPRYRRQRHDEATRLSAQDCLGDRWIALVLGGMFFGLHRFEAMSAALEIAPNILSQRLQLLTRNGLVTWKRPHAGGHGVYSLTEKGRGLFPAVLALLGFAERHLRKGWQKRAGFGHLHRPCADWLHVELACAGCGEKLEGGDVRFGAAATRRAS